MKFIHISDIRFGCTPDANMPWAKERENAVEAAFSRILSACRREEADCLLISGGLFYGQPTLELMDKVSAYFNTIPRVQVIIIGGSQDYAGASSLARAYRWPENVTYAASGELTRISLKESDAEIYAASWTSSREKPDYSALPGETAAAVRILMVYGGDAQRPAVTEEVLNQAGYTYAALGGCSRASVLYEGKAVYSGAPVPLSMKDTGKHGYYAGMTGPDGMLVSLKFIQLPGVRYIPLTVGVTPDSTNKEVIRNVAAELRRRGEKNIYRIRLTGKRSPGEIFCLDELRDGFRIYEITDETEPEYDFRQLFAGHSSDIIGSYVKEMNTEEASEVKRKALYYGVDALLQTAEKETER